MLAGCLAGTAWAAPRAGDAQGAAAATDPQLLSILRRAEQTPRPPEQAATLAEPTGAQRWWQGGRVVRQVSSDASQLVLNALSFVGVRYRYGGDHASHGFDCSGLVRRVYQETLGLVLPHNAAAQSHEGEKVAESQLRPGDLVFFNTLRRAFSHVGIYIGNGEFVHAPRPGQRVQVASLDSPYWARRFDGARRLLSGAAAQLLPSAQAATTDLPSGSPDDHAAGYPAPTHALPAAALPISDAVPANATAATAALMAGAVLPRPAERPAQP